ncbi:ATP-binding cassette domain-containing protein [Aneurinibacillus aneurinilyticus]|jgi:ABC-type multidrug transport system ATPase subunit|uniref:ATP-binding cassette domain-containing protein n=1 Tax=Aneurinibacillus aneurinilyticus TaxID=1391 RepID=UPI0023F9DB54|nr:ABC transporter ATP-binding protein [Aneurinibacillus aneurinilyticus]MCI1695709.1 ABC transporter ATP-binding protein [Aneurinibacillus aneurinilyticus]MED0670733.1 ABC transporter ATP-binding protein [Aneurinibacillus aneurinilyticus]
MKGITVIRTYSLTKRFKSITAVDAVDLHIRRGEIYALLGEPGSGKTTLLRLLLGLMKPTDGVVELFGAKHKHTDRKMMERIGYLHGDSGLLPHMTVVEHLEMHRKLMGIPGKQCIEEALRTLSLSECRHLRAAELPLDMRRRLALARALLHRPELLVLDEPLHGLEGDTRQDLLRLFRDLAQSRQATIVCTGRKLDEIQYTASRIGLMANGSVIKEFGASEILAHFRDRLDIKVSDTSKASVLLEQELRIHDYTVAGAGLISVYEQLHRSAEINRVLMLGNVDVYELSFGTTERSMHKLMEVTEC